MIHLLPQAPLKNRYTEDWIQMWRREMVKSDCYFKIVGDDKPIDSYKLFANANAAVNFELDQMKYVQNNYYDIENILTLDTDFPGIFTAHATFLKWRKPEIKIFGYCHAGSWNNKDIFEGLPGKKSIELSTFETLDKIFVATQYHKDKICNYFNKDFNNIEVVGLPYYHADTIAQVESVIPFHEKDVLLISGRMEQSQRTMVEEFLKRTESLHNLKVETFQRIFSRKQYFDILNRTKISISFKSEETFGLSQLEAHSLGALTLSPNKYSYPELIPYTDLLYDNMDDLCEKFEKQLQLSENSYVIDTTPFEKTIETIVRMVDVKHFKLKDAIEHKKIEDAIQSAIPKPKLNPYEYDFGGDIDYTSLLDEINNEKE